MLEVWFGGRYLGWVQGGMWGGWIGTWGGWVLRVGR